MIPALVVFAYLGIVLYIGIFAFRTRQTALAEDYFLAGRSLGPTVFLLSLFGSNMTAFSILGASGHAFANGIVTYGLMASSSALIIPVTLLVIGTRLWALGKRHGFMTPVQMFRDRWECGHIGTVIFVVQAVLLVPYIIIAVMGGGTTLRTVSNGVVPFWLGGAIVSLVDNTITVLDGPFTEAKELIGGYAVTEVRTKEEAIELGRRLLQIHLDNWPGWEGSCEIRQLFVA